MPNPQPLMTAWRTLRLSAAAPERIAGWDWLVLTASGPAQADLYRAQLAALQRRGRLPDTTRCLVVEDPAGLRIGSGGATLNALAALAAELGGPQAVATARVLLIHAGGDAKRLPWASVVGKVFIPLPLVADPDEPCPTLCDHLLALSAPLPQAMAGGGMLICTGDVLPLADFAQLTLPAQGLAVVTVPAPAALASRHGVIVAAAADGNETSSPVRALLQKPDSASLEAAGGVLPGGRALLDTGIWFAASDALLRLSQLAAAAGTLPALQADGRELGLYDDLPRACLGEDISDRPLGPELQRALAGIALSQHCAPDLRFLHLGTGSEFLQHLAADWAGAVSRRQRAHCGPAVADDAVVVESILDGAARVGGGSVIADSHLGPRCRIGRRCVLQGMDAADQVLTLPDHHALWQVAVRDPSASPAGELQWISAWCGVDDNPKASGPLASLGNRPLAHWCALRGIEADELWAPGVEHSLWQARIFPASSQGPSLGLLPWMIDDAYAHKHPQARDLWRASPRWSLAAMSQHSDAPALLARAQTRADALACGLIHAVAEHGLDRDVAALAADLSPQARHGLLSQAMAALSNDSSQGQPIPAARRHWLRADLLAAAGASAAADSQRQQAWQSISDRLNRHLSPQPPLHLPASISSASSELSARIDLAGGWTDTPPICLDAPAAVCNLALHLPRHAGQPCQAPITASVSLVDKPGFWLELQGPAAPPPCHLDQLPTAAPGLDQPYALLIAVLQVCGIDAEQLAGRGLRLSAASHLPRGSGLGGSSILAAACVQALHRLCAAPDDHASLMQRVLAVEQRLSTGGGWQDQLGGLIPGAKLLTSLPSAPLSVSVQPIPLSPATLAALDQRLLLIDTGITRLAKNVLQRVVGGYLGRRHHMLGSLRRLSTVAEEARDCLACGDVDALGDTIAEAWSLNQSLDPHCSNPQVDQRFAGLPGQWKLTGAGGGGFAIWLIPANLSRGAAEQAATSRGLSPIPWHIA